MADIKSESKFIWMLILHILLTPVTLLLILFKRKEFKDLFRPFYDVIEYIFEPKFTMSIIILNILIFIGSFFLSNQTFTSLINYPSDIFSLRFYSLITSGFLHANLAHLIGNLVGIFIFGRVVERKLGLFKTFLVYFGALIISGLFSSLIHLFIIGDNTGGLGASGALMGLVATAILIDPFYITYELIIPLPIMLSGWIAIYADISGIINPTEDGIGHFAHIGGFISIGLLMFFMAVEEKAKLKKGLIINLISIGLACVIYFLMN